MSQSPSVKITFEPGIDQLAKRVNAEHRAVRAAVDGGVKRHHAIECGCLLNSVEAMLGDRFESFLRKFCPDLPELVAAGYMDAADAAQAQRQLHPLCELFPPIEGPAFDELVTSIKEDGQREAIVLLDEQILDGRNRYRACLAAGVQPRFAPFRGGDPVRFVLNVNVNRRHLNESQRALIAAKLATLRNGANQHRASLDAPTQNEAAEMLNVGRASVQRARQVLEHADPADVLAVTKGEATVSGVAKKIKPGTRNATGAEPESITGQLPEIATGPIFDGAEAVTVHRALEAFFKTFPPILDSFVKSAPTTDDCDAIFALLRAAGDELYALAEKTPADHHESADYTSGLRAFATKQADEESRP